MNNNAEVIPAILMFFSTNGPPKDAPMPRKKIDSENANWTLVNDNPVNVAISPENNEKAYTEPIGSVNRIDGIMEDLKANRNFFIRILYQKCKYKLRE